MNIKLNLNTRNLPVLVTVGLFFVMFIAGSFAFPGFFEAQNFLNLFVDNAYLLILAVGMTFVIISGGIDLSVGSMLALTTMVSSSLLEKSHVSPFIVIPLVLIMGIAFGLFFGFLIAHYNLPPFIITLGGLYLGRGLCYVVSLDSIVINNDLYKMIAHYQIKILGAGLSVGAVIALVMVAVGIILSRYTKFGRTAYAIGGNEQSAVLMGLQVEKTKIMIYAFSGFCAALSGIVFTFYTLSGYALNGSGMELDTIAAVVIGGTLLSGGVGSFVGTIFGVLVYGSIQVLIIFQGQINSWWTRIIIGVLIFLFCVLQRFFEVRSSKNTGTGKIEVK